MGGAAVITTEEEAKKKWCPFTRVLVEKDLPVSVNRANQTGAGAKYKGSTCIASECQAWRWATKSNPDFKECNVWPDRRARHEMDRTLPDHERGYCGLAGKPND